MLNKIKIKIKNKNEIFALVLLLIITIVSTTYYNYTKTKIKNNYKNIINNIYFKKTINHLFDNFEPKFKKVRHQIEPGETFDKILNKYSIKKSEIEEIKKKLSDKINLNKLNTTQKILFTVDQSNNSISKFIFHISNKERILLSKDLENNFNQKIVLTSLKKEIIFNENVILQSLYKSASEKKIPANIIIDFARICIFK